MRAMFLGVSLLGLLLAAPSEATLTFNGPDETPSDGADLDQIAGWEFTAHSEGEQGWISVFAGYQDPDVLNLSLIFPKETISGAFGVGPGMDVSVLEDTTSTIVTVQLVDRVGGYFVLDFSVDSFDDFITLANNHADGSASNTPVSVHFDSGTAWPVPEPSAALIFGIGLLLTGASLRRSSRSRS